MSTFCCRLCGQTSFSSLDELWQYAEDHSPQIGESLARREIATAAIRQSRSNFLPSINLNGAFTDNITLPPTLVPGELFGGEPGTFVEEKFGRRYSYSAGLTAQLDLINLSNWFAVKNARLEESVSDLTWKLTRESVYKATAGAYFNYYLMHESEKLAGESFKTAEIIRGHAESLFQQGQISEVTLNTAEIHVKEASVSLLTSQQSKRNALNHLKQWLDMSVSDSLVLSESWTFSSLGEMDELALPGSLQIDQQLSEVQVLAARSVWQASKAAYAPTLNAVYAYNMQIAGDELFNFDNGNTLPQQYLGLRLTVPLVVDGTRSFQVYKARQEYETAMKQDESISQQAALNDDTLLGNYETALKRVQTANEILELHHDNDKHAALQFEAGQISLDDRLRVYQDYLAYKNEYLRNLSEFYTHYGELKVRQQQL